MAVHATDEEYHSIEDPANPQKYDDNLEEQAVQSGCSLCCSFATLLLSIPALIGA
jgi:hypothetical protein